MTGLNEMLERHREEVEGFILERVRSARGGAGKERDREEREDELGPMVLG